jgi:hypothetical protein
MADIWVNFADGRVATVRLHESARVQDIAERAGVVLHQRACRIAIVMEGGTDPLAHEARLCDIVPPPRVFYVWRVARDVW